MSKQSDLKIKKKKKTAIHTVALVESHEKYVVKKHGSFPSVILYSGTSGDRPSKAVAISMYFCKNSLVYEIRKESILYKKINLSYLQNKHSNKKLTCPISKAVCFSLESTE